ncbi:hypothetical protein M9Y10_002825 [Tritrichomonas musculus]|uniref:NET domain-containing protein n=1 Tax=Tritrichomonas musculus TaxID=1915356 RepID=A0ABR2LBR1_9EUKA
MDQLRVQSCLKILKKLMCRPICRPFLLNESGEIHYQRLRNLKCDHLETIEKDLIDGKITSYSMFFSRLNSFLDAVLPLCNEKVAKICANELKQYVSKMKKKAFSNSSNISVWTNNLKNTYSDLIQSLSTAEQPMEELKYRIETDPSEPLFMPFDSLETRLLVKAIKMIENDKTMNGVISIVRSLEPSNSKSATGEFVCNLTSCKPQTLYTLRNYVQNQFKKEGIQYPESNSDNNNT